MHKKNIEQPKQINALKDEGFLNKKRVLFVTPTACMEKSSGGGIVTLERLRALLGCSEVHVLTMSVDDLARQCFPSVSWHVAGNLKNKNLNNLIQSYLDKLPLSVWRNTSTELLELALNLAKFSWDCIYVDHWLMIEVAKIFDGNNKVLHLHNAEPEVFFRASKNASFIRKILMLAEAYRCANYLRNNTLKFQELHLLSNDDAARLAERAIKHPITRVFLPAVSFNETKRASFEIRRNEVLFIGTLSWHANEEGLEWYATKIVNLIANNISHQIVGGGANARLVSILSEHPKIVIHGYVDDLEPLYQSAKCLAAPLLSGSGIKIKIINALARGLPVVTTSVGIEGFPTGYQEAIMLADTPSAFAKEVEKLMNDNFLWTKSSQAALDYFEQHFSGNKFQQWAEACIL